MRKRKKCSGRYGCGRLIPIKRGRFVPHNIQGKNWVNSDGTKDKCMRSGEHA